ncbi:WYL domain-containing protein [Chloroflexota bacterium]
MEKTICTAINLRQVVRFYYQDALRLVEPYCYGVLSDDHEALLCFQVGGRAKYIGVEGWKLFRFSEISELEITEEQFADTRQWQDPEYDSRYSVFVRIVCEVPVMAYSENGTAIPTRGAIERDGGERAHYKEYKERGHDAVSVGDHYIKMKRFRLFHVLPWLKWFKIK